VRYRKVFLFLALLALIISPFFLLPRILKIGEINCKSQFGPCSKNLEEKMRNISQEKKNLSETKKELTAFLESDIIVNDFSFQFKLPDKLEINIIERKSKFAVQNQNGMVALIDGNGYAITIEDSTGLPRLITPESLPNVGEKVTEETLFALELLYDMFSFYQVRTGKIDKSSLVIELSRGPKVIFPLEGNRQALLGSLRLVLAKLNSDSQVSTIDLRFKNPVIK